MSNNHVKHTLEIMVAVLFIIIGGAIYLLFRPKSLLVFEWVDSCGIGQLVDYARQRVSDVKPRDFIVFNLPNALWTISYLLSVNALIESRRLKLVVAILLPAFAIILEFCQMIGVINGTFDVIDLGCYLLPLVIYLIIYKFTLYEEIS